MTGLEAYALYKAIRLHFTSESYDCFKYGFKTGGTSQESFETKRDRYFYVKLTRLYTREEVIGVLASAYYRNPKLYIRDVFSEDVRAYYLSRKKVQESLSYTVEKDLTYLLRECRDPNELLLCPSGSYPRLLEYTLQGDIEVETLIVLNYLLNVFPTWNKQIQDPIQWPSFYFRVRKYTPFLSFDGTKMKEVVKKVLDNYK